jgi:hypothetical protein
MPERSPANMVRRIACPGAAGHPRRIGGWLLLGWGAFWLAAATPLCGTAVAGQQKKVLPVALTAGAGGHQAPSNHSHDPVPAGKHCPDATAAAAVAPSAAAATPDHRDSPRMVQFAFEAFTMRLEHSPSQRNGILPAPPPRAPLYLRNQRILI